MADLKPCPFCGKRPHHLQGHALIMCANKKCAVKPMVLGRKSDKPAIAAWNRRAK